MNHTNQFPGEVKGGQFRPDDPRYHGALARFNGKRVVMSFGPPIKKRSNAENRYYRGVVLPILAEAYGATGDRIETAEEEMHRILGPLFWHDLDAKGRVRVRSTTSYSTAEFEQIMSKIRTWASVTLGAYVPEPNEERALA